MISVQSLVTTKLCRRRDDLHEAGLKNKRNKKKKKKLRRDSSSHTPQGIQCHRFSSGNFLSKQTVITSTSFLGEGIRI